MAALAWPVACGGSTGGQATTPDAAGAGGAVDAAEGAGGSGGSAAAAGTGASGAGGTADAGVEASDAAPDAYDDAAAVLPVEAKLIDGRLAIDRQGNFLAWGAYAPSGWSLVQVAPGPFVDGTYACGIRATGKLVCWDDMSGWLSNPPQGPFQQVVEGTFSMCGLRFDGTVACYGAGTDPAGHTTCALYGEGGNVDCGQSAPPPGTFIQVTAGWLFSCGIRTDGTIACWGLGQPGDMCGTSGPCDPLYSDGGCPVAPCVGTATPPAGTFVKMSTGGSASCAIRTDGTLACWGWGYAAIPSGTFIDVSPTDASACAVRTDGSLVCWGYPDLSPPSGRFLQVSTTGWSACALRDDYAVLCWGSDKYGDVSQAPASL